MSSASILKSTSAPDSLNTCAASALNAAYVFSLEAVTFLFVPPAPSSTINKSASTTAAPISVAPSISRSATAIEPSGNTGAAENV